MLDAGGNPYDGFAWAYDRYFGKSFVESSSHVLKKLLFDRVPRGGRILDLCCGPGRVANELSLKGYSVMGVDSSRGMLVLAARIAPSCEFVQADARTFALGRSFEGCVCLSASMNLLMVAGELGSVFERVYSHLVPGGVFLFDMNMEECFATRWKAPYGSVAEGDAIVVRPRFDPRTNVATVEMTAFRLGASGLYERSDWSFRERCYSEKEVRSELKRASFRDVKAYRSGSLGLDKGRMFFACTR